jgi:hypothetical protein
VTFAHLFMVSLVPFSTAWVADTRLAAVPVSVYAAVFVLVNLAYCAFVWEALAQAEVEEIPARMRRITLTRSFLTLEMFVIAMLLSLKIPLWGFGSVCCAFACLSSAGSPGISHMKMRVTLKVNNACAARNAVAGKSNSSSSGQIRLRRSLFWMRWITRTFAVARSRAQLRLARICNCFSHGRKNGS